MGDVRTPEGHFRAELGARAGDPVGRQVGARSAAFSVSWAADGAGRGGGRDRVLHLRQSKGSRARRGPPGQQSAYLYKQSQRFRSQQAPRFHGQCLSSISLVRTVLDVSVGVGSY